MNFDPQKFFIGLVDFFSILMPGAILAYVVKDSGASMFSGSAGPFPLTGLQAGIMFFFVSYLLGHFVFLISAALDDWVYDPVREWTDWGQISKRLARGKALSAPWQRKLAMSSWLFGTTADNAVIQAQRIKARALHGFAPENAVNAFQWCKVWLTKELPQGLLAVQRFEADSKFFRSFFVVLGTLTLIYLHRRNWLAAILCFTAMLPALWRYVDQRFKATQQAYWFVIALEAMQANRAAAPPPREDGLSLAGGVVYQQTMTKTIENGVEKEVETVKFMLVEASKQRSEWVLPKGHIEPGEDPRITAVREVREETGHWAKLTDWLEDGRLDKKDTDSPLVRWFLLEACEELEKPRPEGRQNKWFDLENAKQTARFEETRTLLDQAAEKLKQAAKDRAESKLMHRT